MRGLNGEDEKRSSKYDRGPAEHRIGFAPGLGLSGLEKGRSNVKPSPRSLHQRLFRLPHVYFLKLIRLLI